MSLYFTLDDDLKPVPSDGESYWDWFRSMPESSGWYTKKTGIGFKVADTNVDGIRVSTVYLGLDHSYGGGSGPLLWETMIFPGEGFQERYASHDEAIERHRELVETIRSGRIDEEMSKRWHQQS